LTLLPSLKKRPFNPAACLRVVGRRFCFDGVEAVWLSGEGQIKIYDDQGECLQVVNVGDEQRRKAA
jgi:hypothetical protein